MTPVKHHVKIQLVALNVLVKTIYQLKMKVCGYLTNTRQLQLKANSTEVSVVAILCCQIQVSDI